MTRTPALVLIALLVVALAGCVPAKAVDVAPSRTPTLGFASDEEALAAAVEAYSEYQLIGDQIGHDGGLNPDRIKQVVTYPLLDDELEGYRLMSERAIRQTGWSAHVDAELIDRDEGHILISICDDIREVDLVDAQGRSVLPEQRPSLGTMRVLFEIVSDTNEVFISNRILEANAC